ncbi:sensor domain-containing diguanylate cyclase [Galenea microaerophila]
MSILIIFLLILSSLLISFLNFHFSLQAKKEALKTHSFPISIDAISTGIQENIIQPNLIASVMAHDTFVHNWLQNNESDVSKIQNYLETLTNRYDLFVAHLVSDKTLHYYTQNGLIEKLNPQVADNQWYFKFKNSAQNQEFNIDYNDKLDQGLLLFINQKIFSKDGVLLGATGVGMRMSSIQKILKHFRTQYQFKVYFINRQGQVLLHENTEDQFTNLNEIPELAQLKPQILSSDHQILEFSHQGEEFLINSKYIPELDAYLMLQAKLEDFTRQAYQTFYLNLFISLLITSIISILVLAIIRQQNRRLIFLANNDPLTKLKNRRFFNDRFDQWFSEHLKESTPALLSFIFFDIDNFKQINDQFGHATGDKVLTRVSQILLDHFKNDTLIARWGGEEFIIMLKETTLQQASDIAEALRHKIEQDAILKSLINQPVTVSVGVANLRKNETQASIFNRLDAAMYRAKKGGKNQVVTD